MSSDELSQAYTIAAYLRVASIAVALYDYLETQPTAWRFYRQQWVARRISSVIYVSIITLTLSNVGFFYYHFSPAVCRKYFLLAPAFKVLQAMVSQVIIGVRAYNLSRRSKVIATFLVFIYTIACVLQWVTTMFQRSRILKYIGDHLLRFVSDARRNSCGAFNERKLLGAWIHYVVAIVYDIVVTAISILYLLKYKPVMNNSMCVLFPIIYTSAHY
ncbi:hypothetical protein BDQ17DRAFT_1250715 [Cyathus striatus]|nr:hypothetical protein BDQ17DRAFT_1250715 [Cyathus striatus]